MKRLSRLSHTMMTCALIAALLLPAETAAATGPTPFDDIGNSFAEPSIEALYSLGVTAGTSPTTFSPRATVTREQMATFLGRLYEVLVPQPCSPAATPFVDVDAASYAAGPIGCMYRLGITAGTSPTRYSPRAPVSREQMAAFLARFYDEVSDNSCTPGATPFTDVPDSSFAVEAVGCIYGLGITTGTSPTQYSPAAVVTREQMAAFLIRLYNQLRSEGAGSDDSTGAVCCSEGSAGFVVTANSSWNQWTSGGHWSWFEEHVDRAIVFVPYWDSRLESFSDVWAYRNSYGISTDTASDARSVDHPEWVLRDADGDPVYIPFGCGGGCAHFAGDVGNPAYRADFVEQVRDLVERGYTGLKLDDVNFMWRFGDQNGNEATPIDPRTGVALTLADWQRYLAEFLEQLRAEFPQLEIVHNTIWYADAPTFSNQYVNRAIRAADYISLERGVNDGGLKGGAGKFSLLAFFDNIDRIHALGTNVIFVDRSATNEAEQRYNFAALLLVNNGNDLVSTDSKSMGSPDGWWSEFDVDLGHAIADRTYHDGLFVREFTEGVVLLNEPGNGPVTYTPDEPMRDPAGNLVTSVTLDAQEGMILRSV